MEPYNTKYLVDRLYIELSNHISSNKKLVLDRPEISSANKKTYIGNFKEICNKLNRKTEEVKVYFESELRAPCNLSQAGALVITGVFKQAGVSKVLSSYIKDNVTCKECNSCDTEIIKENRISFLKCNKCKSKKSFSNQ